MKFLLILLITTSAFADGNLAKAFEKREEKDCVRLLSEIRKKSRATAGLTEKISKVEIGTDKNSKYALLYLKLSNDLICSEQLSRTDMAMVTVKYICRDRSGKVTLEKNVEAGYSECTGDAPKYQ